MNTPAVEKEEQYILHELDNWHAIILTYKTVHFQTTGLIRKEALYHGLK